MQACKIKQWKKGCSGLYRRFIYNSYDRLYKKKLIEV